MRAACATSSSRRRVRAAELLLPRCRRRWRCDGCNHFVGGGPISPPPSPPGGKQLRLAIKDNIATAGFPTQCASRMLAGYVSPYEATIVRQLRVRGAVIVGKTNMDEFGMGSHSTNSMHGPVLNPLSPHADDPISAGGSSGGSAVAVALDDADVAIGTDTGGSIRLPAAYTGVVGYRPSYGMLSRYGVIDYAQSLDTVGLVAREPSILLHLVFRTGLDKEHDPHDPTSLSAETRARCAAACPPELAPNDKLTVGLPIEYNVQELDSVIHATWLAVAAALEAAGVTVIPVSLPTMPKSLSVYYVLAAAEASSNLAKYDGVRYGGNGRNVVVGDGQDAATDGSNLYAKYRGALFGDEVKRRILLGNFSLSSVAMDNYFIKAQRVRRLICRDFDRVFRLGCPLRPPTQFDLSDIADQKATVADKRGPPQVDFLLTPTTPTFPPRLSDVLSHSSLDAYANDVFTVPASLAGLPAISLPVWNGDSKLPVGLQLMGQFWDDRRLLHMTDRIMGLMK
ncbi:hypothetical protein L249_0750 [Ophiocordyceps polyrhachis-furcata BCC 54312]|uniref:Glutamyl-tRNA(Gln) amidotransferase subunit A, mitochondrial n=1 Tax=Ophiocordyceps polyrhachis-furcata BCC 54312 TaxID=1330021 RepID=A0A367LF33_9HYPO|nr:hypothetical protein L249_0750 [Ophiocordyceps polyrhachis-furcata BCC 54312]